MVQIARVSSTFIVSTIVAGFSNNVAGVRRGESIIGFCYARDPVNADMAIALLNSDIGGAFTKRVDISQTGNPVNQRIQIFTLENTVAGTHTVTGSHSGTIDEFSYWLFSLTSYAAGLVGAISTLDTPNAATAVLPLAPKFTNSEMLFGCTNSTVDFPGSLKEDTGGTELQERLVATNRRIGIWHNHTGRSTPITFSRDAQPLDDWASWAIEILNPLHNRYRGRTPGPGLRRDTQGFVNQTTPWRTP